MHQILGLRPFFDEKSGQWIVTDGTFFKRGWRAPSLIELFADLDTYLKKIPKGERWNLFYTIANCADGKREFKEQHVLAIDVDKIPAEFQARKLEYIPHVLAALDLKEKETGIVDSGNGLHFLVGLNRPITEESYFSQNKRHFEALCAKVDAALVRAGLPGEADRSVFDARRILRLPSTINRKEGKPEKKCALIQSAIVNIDFDLTARSGLPTVAAEDQIAAQVMKRHATPDTQAIMDGCEFLKWSKEKPNDVRESHWYAMLSVVARLPPDGRALAHQYSRGHASYSSGETETKIDQALAASGPRTCNGINKLWGKCEGCKFFGKVNSPIQIQGETYIRTKDTGFWLLNDKGAPTKPQFDDLRMFFERENQYVALDESGICLVWNGKFWEQYGDKRLESYAQEHFDPPANTAMTQEFKNLVGRTNLRPSTWFTETTRRKINFQNGVLDLDTNVFSAHDSGLGFRYVLGYDYDPKAEAPAFKKFLGEIMNERDELVETLLQFSGYAFSGDLCWAQKCLILTGEGSNGKSTFMDVLKALAGRGNTSSLTLAGISSETNRYMMASALFNLAEETPRNMIDSDVLKNLVSGGEMTVKMLYKQPFNIECKTKLIFACNELPRNRDSSKGFFRRLVIVPFDRAFEGATSDPFLKDKLLLELPGIFNMILGAYHRLRKTNLFPKSEIVEKHIADYRNDTDNVRAWVAECITMMPLPEDHAERSKLPCPSLAQLYASYRTYTEGIGERPEPRPTVARRLKILFTPLEYEARWERAKGAKKREVTFTGISIHDGSGY